MTIDSIRPAMAVSMISRAVDVPDHHLLKKNCKVRKVETKG